MRIASRGGGGGGRLGWSPVPATVGHEEQDLADAAESVLQ